MFSLWVWLALLAFSLISPFLYNLFFHPLRHFPGPVAARGSSWWRAVKEVFQQQSLTHLLFDLHEEYGDIIRVSPNELHFANPAAFHEIYNSCNRWDKHHELYDTNGIKNASFTIPNYEHAKERRAVLQPMFSKRAIESIERMIWQRADGMASNMATIFNDGLSVDLLHAFRSFALDAMMSFTFGSNIDTIHADKFNDPLVIAMNSSLASLPLMKNFPLIRKIAYAIPPSIGMNMMPNADQLTARIYEVNDVIKRQLNNILNTPEKLDDTAHQTIFHRLLDKSSYKGQKCLQSSQIMDEGMTLLSAGAHTVADTLMVGHWHLLHQPELIKQLHEEVTTVWPNIHTPPTFNMLKRLPLLSATIKEFLRLGPMGVSFTRIVPPEGAVISGRRIPGGTTVGMCINHVHLSEKIFKNAKTFDPFRWLADDATGLEQWLVAFSRGPRACLGVNLAWAELYIGLATMIRRFNMSIDGTTAQDMEWRECFAAYFPGRHLHAWCKPIPE